MPKKNTAVKKRVAKKKRASVTIGSLADFAALIVRLRTEMKITQAAFAKKMGTSQSAIARFEKGKTDVRIDTAVRMMAALGVKGSFHLG